MKIKNLIIKDGFPILHVESERRGDGYLSPFRGYRFQVSGTEDGQGDYGSSEVIGLCNIKPKVLSSTEVKYTSVIASNVNSRTIYAEILRGQALIALSRFSDENIPSYCLEPFGSYKEKSEEKVKLFNDFILGCVDYLNSMIQ